MKLKKYPEYKDSGLPWIKKIPSHWKILPNRAIFKERNIKNMCDEELLSVTIKKCVIRQSELVNNSSKKDSSNEDKSNYKLVMINDLPYNKMRMWQGAVGTSKYRGIVSPAYIILIPMKNIHSNFYHYLLRTKEFIQESHRYSYGICDDQLSLRFKDFKVIKSLVPPFLEQEKIASFIYYKEKLISKFIRNKRRLIELLKEEKQAIINQAVTRGLNPNVKLKPSGIEWLGDIPEHWQVKKLKRLTIFSPSKSELGHCINMSEKVVFLPMEKVSIDGKVDCSEKQKLTAVWNGFTYFKRGDVVLAKITPCFENGKGAYLKNLETEYGFGTTEFIVIRPSKTICGNFLYYLTMTTRFRKEGEEVMTGAAGQKRISTNFVKNYILALPSLREQSDIVNFIDKRNSEIDHVIEKAQREIDLIQEYRTRLISDVVTGKIDVRDIYNYWRNSR